MSLYLKIFHVVANLIWIGSILGTALMLVQGPGDAKTRGASGLLLYMKLAVPAFVVSFLCGTAMVASNVKHYFVLTHNMHGKLPLALGVIALHHVIGARAKKMANGTSEDAGPTKVLAMVLLLCAIGSAVFVLIPPI
jgi:protoporphyrinogen IX oxidase